MTRQHPDGNWSIHKVINTYVVKDLNWVVVAATADIKKVTLPRLTKYVPPPHIC